MKAFTLLLMTTVAVVTGFFAPVNHYQYHHHPNYDHEHHHLHHQQPAANGHHHLVTGNPATSHHPSSALHVSWWDRDDESRWAAMHHNIMRTDLRNFLTQRSLQSFVHLCIQCRDPHTVKWLEDFGGWAGLENFHGTGALNLTTFPDWSAVLMDLMQEPDDVVVVSVKRRGQGVSGWSKNNPYIDTEEKYIEFNIDIDPPSLTNRILAVREQIAAEWVADLDTLKLANDEVLESYNDKIKAARDAEEAARKKAAEECSGDGSYEDMECSIAAGMAPKVAFERNAMYYLRNSNAYTEKSPSMLRNANFDLLCLLATQESIHRVLRDYVDAGNEHEVSLQWFREFYVKRVAKYFDGNQQHGSADNFLEELLLTSPTIKQADNGKMGIIDPLRIAEDIIGTRSKVAMEWKEQMKTVKEDHTIVRIELLDKQMLKWGHKPKPTPAKKVEPKVEPKLGVAVSAADNKKGKNAASKTKKVKQVKIFGEFQ